jgi:hypothetical protein
MTNRNSPIRRKNPRIIVHPHYFNYFAESGQNANPAPTGPDRAKIGPEIVDGAGQYPYKNPQLAAGAILPPMFFKSVSF